MFSRDQGLKPISILAWIALAFFIITRPGLSSQSEAFTLPNDNGQPVHYTLIGPGEAGCSAYVWEKNYRWICTDNPEGDNRFEPILPDSDGLARFTVYYDFQGPDEGEMAPEYSTPLYYQDYQVFTKNFPLLYTTDDGCLVTPHRLEEDLLRLIRIALEKIVQILLFSLGAIKIQPTSPKSYKGKPMKNPWWMSAKKRRGEKSQVPLQEDTTALTLSISFAEYQLSSNPPDAAAPLDTLPPSLPDQAEDTNPGADISRPLAANAAGSKDIALGNVVASTDFTDSSFWNKHKRDPRAVIPRKRRAVLAESSVRP